MAHHKGGGDTRNELKLEAVVQHFSKIIVDAYESNCPVKLVTSSRNVS